MYLIFLLESIPVQETYSEKERSQRKEKGYSCTGRTVIGLEGIKSKYLDSQLRFPLVYIKFCFKSTFNISCLQYILHPLIQ